MAGSQCLGFTGYGPDGSQTTNAPFPGKHVKRQAGGESVSQSLLKDQEFSTFPDQNPRLERQPEKPARLPAGTVAPHAQAAARRLRKGAETAKIGTDSEVVREFHTDAV
jgi:hypothetical protein